MWPGRIWWPGQGLHREPQTDSHNGPFYACLQLHHVPGHPPAQHFTSSSLFTRASSNIHGAHVCSCVQRGTRRRKTSSLSQFSMMTIWYQYNITCCHYFGPFCTGDLLHKKDSNLSLIIKQEIERGSLHCKPIWQPIKWSYKLRAKAI